MKSLQCFLFLWMLIAIESKLLDKKLLFDGCDHDGWKVKNISIVSIDDKINVTANIMNSTIEKTSNFSELVIFTLTGCNNNLTCTNYTNLSDEILNCTVNKIELEQEKCTVIKIIEDWTRESSNLKLLRENKNSRDGCILYENISTPSPETTTKKSEQKANGTIDRILLNPLLKHLTVNPSLF